MKMIILKNCMVMVSRYNKYVERSSGGTLNRAIGAGDIGFTDIGHEGIKKRQMSAGRLTVFPKTVFSPSFKEDDAVLNFNIIQ
jgi:hypothetical protein